MEFIGFAKAALELANSSAGLAAALTGTMTIFGVNPVLGPGRALRLGLSSWIARREGPPSLRQDEVTKLRNWLSIREDCRDYYVITGEKGVGKSCMLKTALHRIPGVVSVTARAGQSDEEICTNVLKSIGKRTPYSFGDPILAAQRTIACYRFMFRCSPIVVLNAAERGPGLPPANIAGAVRDLLDKYKLRVIVDSSPNTLDIGVLRTGRESVLQLERMSKEQIFSIEEFADIFNTPETAKWKEAAWKVIGGNPLKYVKLSEKIRDNSNVDRGEVIADFLSETILEAVDIVIAAKNNKNDMDEILEKLKQANFELKPEDIQHLTRSDPDKVLRTVSNKDRILVLVPSSHAIDLVLRHDLKGKPSIAELLSLLNQS